MRNLCDETVHDGIAKGSCVMIEDAAIVYAGPLNDPGRPDASGKMVLLNPEDFATLKSHVDKTRH